MAKQFFLEYCESEQKKMENALIKLNALDSIPESPSPYILSYYKRLAITHRIQENFVIYYDILKKISVLASDFTKSKEPEYLKEEKYQNDIYLKTSHLRNYGEFQFNTGVYLFLAHGDNNKIHQLFEWAEENCTLSDELIKSYQTKFDEIAHCFLWRGYALLSLERYEEAYDCLTRVAPILQNVKKSGREMWRIVELALTKALIPLCEFKHNPTKENLKRAQKGVEDYIKSLHDNMEKLDGYVYYFHLKEQFAEVYNADPKTISAPEVIRKSLIKTKTPPVNLPNTVDIQGSVIIYDPGKSTAFGIVGRNTDLTTFVSYVKNLGGFPELAGLMDLYTLGQPQDAKPIAAESRKFIITPGIDPAMQKIARIIYDATKEAADAGSEVKLYYDPELDPDSPG